MNQYLNIYSLYSKQEPRVESVEFHNLTNAQLLPEISVSPLVREFV